MPYLFVDFLRAGRKLGGYCKAIGGLRQGYQVDGHHLVGVVHHAAREQCRVGAHAHNVLIVVVARYAVHIHGVRQRLALGRGAGLRELHGLHAVV